MLLKGFAILLIGASVGFFLGTKVSHETSSPVSLPPETKSRLEQLANVDIDEYYRLKGSETKFQKADEIFGKIVAIFLADLSLHVKSVHPQLAKEVPNQSQPPANKQSAPAQVDSKPTESKFSQSNWHKDEGPLLALRNEQGIAEELERLKLPYPTAAWEQAASFKNRNEQLQGLTGRFSGTSNVSVDGKDHAWDTVLFLNAQMSKDKLNGTFKAILSENGKTFSNSSNNGDIRSFKEAPGDSKTVLAHISPTLMFQLYYLKELDQLVGNIYKRASEDDPFQHIGNFALKRN